VFYYLSEMNSNASAFRRRAAADESASVTSSASPVPREADKFYVQFHLFLTNSTAAAASQSDVTRLALRAASTPCSVLFAGVPGEDNADAVKVAVSLLPFYSRAFTVLALLFALLCSHLCAARGLDNISNVH
jgi:hypothetical protein